MNNIKDNERIINNFKNTLALEGLDPSGQVVEIIKKHLNGIITKDEALKMINEFVTKNYLL